MEEKLNLMEERGGLSPAPSTHNASDQNRVTQAQETGGTASADTTVDTTPKRSWTPGPWRWQGEDYFGGWGWQLLVGDKGQGIVCGEQAGVPYRWLRAYVPIDPELCKTGMESGDDSAPCVHVLQPDARLIAAAPELFEALEGFVNEMPICCCHESWTKRGRVDPQCVRCNFKDCIAEADAALAKALGGQP